MNTPRICFLSFIIIFQVVFSFSCAQEKEFKPINKLINEINSSGKVGNDLMYDETMRELSVLSVQYIKKFSTHPLGYYAKSFYYEKTQLNVDSAFFLFKKAIDLSQNLDIKEGEKICERYDFCKMKINHKLDSLSIASYNFYSKNIESINSFLKKYPNTVKGYELATNKQVELSYLEMNKSMSIYNYKSITDNFLQRFPNSIYRDSVLLRVEYFDFQAAQNRNTIAEYNIFLEQHPKSKYTESVLIKIETLEFEEVKKTNKIENFNSFLEKYPNSIYKTEIEKFIEEQRLIESTFRNLMTIEDCEKFVKEYPTTELGKKVYQLINNYQRLEFIHINSRNSQEILPDAMPEGLKNGFLIKYFNYKSWLSNSTSWMYRYEEKNFKYIAVNSIAHKLFGLDSLINEWKQQQSEYAFLMQTKNILESLRTSDKNLDVKESILFYTKHFGSDPEKAISSYLEKQFQITDSLLDANQSTHKKIMTDIRKLESLMLTNWAFTDSLKVPIYKHFLEPNYFDEKSMDDMRNFNLYSDSAKFLKLFLPDSRFVTNDTANNPLNKKIAIVGQFQNSSHFSQDLDGVISYANLENGLYSIKFIKEFGYKFDNRQMHDKIRKVHIDKKGSIFFSLFSEGASSIIHFENRIIKLNESGDTLWTSLIQTDKRFIGGRCVFLETDDQNNLYALFGSDGYAHGGTFDLVKLNQTTGEIIWIKEDIGNHVTGVLGGACIYNNTLYFVINFTHDFNNKSFGYPFNPYLLVIDSKGQQKTAKPFISEEPKLITSVEIIDNTIVAKGRRGEYEINVHHPISDPIDEIELDQYKYETNDKYSHKPYYLILDLSGNIIKTNGIE